MTITAGISKVARHFQITVPKYVRESMDLHEGDLVNFEVRDGKVIFTPVVLRNKDQAYFWTQAWQSDVRESRENFKKGNFKKFKSIKEMKKHFSAK